MINMLLPSTQELVLDAQSNAIFEGVADAMMIISKGGVVQAANAAAEKIFGRNRTELVGVSISTLTSGIEWPVTDFYISGGDKLNMVFETKAIREGDDISLSLSIGGAIINGQEVEVGVFHDISDRKKILDQVTYLATHDSLTGCLNRNYLHDNLQRLMLACKDGSQQVVAAYIDLDDFKCINDRYDHQVGDDLLRRFAHRLKDNLDVGGLVCRLGGDEFFIASIRPNERSAPRRLVQGILDCLERPFKVNGIEIAVRASIGISLYPGHSSSSDQLVSDADIAMYQAKADGGSCMRFFRIAMREKLNSVFKTVGRLRRAIEQNQFELHYQLQFELFPPYRPSGLEALLRWRDINGYVSPEVFIPLAEEYGLMPAISRWVLERACLDNKYLISEGLLDVAVAVNVCSRTFVQNEFVGEVSATLSRANLPASRLEIEVTESIAILDVAITINTISSLHDLGVEVSIDDFGTGYSSLRLLKSLPVDRLKIDKSFVRDFPGSGFDQAVIQAILTIAKSVGIQVVAEGIETIEQCVALNEQGCNYGQGFWYAKPLPLDELKKILSEKRA